MFRRRREPGQQRWAAIFAEDLTRGSEELLAVAGDGRNDVTLPITIPIDETTGVVLLQPEGPLDAPRLPAVMGVSRSADTGFNIRIERWDGGPFVLPGVADGRSPDGGDAELTSLGLNVTSQGLLITAFGIDRRLMPLAFTEDTARALANAVFIAVRMKLTQARAGQEQ